MAAGNGVSSDNPAFLAISQGVLPQSNLHFLEKRSDIPRVLRGLDFFVLSSVSEAFPNSLLEAMATGLPAVATDVGACAEALPDGEPLVAPGKAEALCEAIHSAFMQDDGQRARRGATNREHVVQHFGLERMVARFDALFEQAAQR
jgi:glycosyltransferase involved in cell wall biosynthesis